MKKVTFLCSILLCSATAREFPSDFILGASTAAYQIEGAWNEDGKGENIWDHITHTRPHKIVDRSNGDIAGDSYHNYARDIEMIRELGLNAYRFSIAWTRILPNGFKNEINEAGIHFYNKVIDELIAYNVTPVVTLYHWDLPQILQDFGGFTNPLFIDWFLDYAEIVFKRFGDRVKHWIPFNEPKQICHLGYGWPLLAPMLNSSGVGEYLCTKYLLIANAKTYHMYQEKYKSIQGGRLGYAVDIPWIEPATSSEADKYAVEMQRSFEWYLYTDPIFSKEGGWPIEVIDRVAEKSAVQGFPRSRLPELSDEEKVLIRGTADFFGFNQYHSIMVSATENLKHYPVPSLIDDINVGTVENAQWKTDVFGRTPRSLDSIFRALQELEARYGNITFYITENGVATKSGLEDDDRVEVIHDALESVLNAIDAGINVKGYCFWSLMDNFEWRFGYSHRFGLYEIDYNDPARRRTPRKSAFVYKNIIKTRRLDVLYEPTNRTMKISN